MQPTNDTPITLTLGLVNGLLGYLGTRPFAEVHQIIQAIQEQAAPQVPVPQAEEAKDETVQ